MKTDTRTRIECTNWDDEVAVATWAKGRTRKPARKVLTKGVAKLELKQSALKGMSAEELAQHDLHRDVKRVWSVAEA